MQNPQTALAKWPNRRLHLVVLAAATVVAWAPALTGAFHYDDFANIVLDPATSHWDALLTRLGNGFRPLLRLSYAADHALWGFNPAGFLATNFIVHLMAVAAVWRLAAYRFGDPLAALFAALVFALQPAHAQAVAWASGRSAELSTLLLCLALLAHERGVERRGWKWPTASVALMGLAVAVKEVAVIFPAIVLLWEATRPGAVDLRTMIRRAAPSALAAAGGLTIMLVASSRLRALLGFSLGQVAPLDALADHVRALPVSFSLWFRPWALSVEHLNPVGTAPLALGGVTLAAMLGLGTWNLRRRPFVALALLWPLVMLLPSHSFIARCDLVVEKPLYGAWIGPSLAFGALLAASARAQWWWLPFRVSAVVLLLVVLLATTHWRARMWADPVALWREATVTAPLSTRAWNNLANGALRRNELGNARFAIEQLRALDPDEPALANFELSFHLMALTNKEDLSQ